MGEFGLSRLIPEASGSPLPSKGCKHPKKAQPLHSCPFRVDVHDDSEYQCTCCKECEHECLMDT